MEEKLAVALSHSVLPFSQHGPLRERRFPAVANGQKRGGDVWIAPEGDMTQCFWDFSRLHSSRLAVPASGRTPKEISCNPREGSAILLYMDDNRPNRMRGMEEKLAAALSQKPVVLLQGPREAGKTTLARLAVEVRPTRYVTLDDAVVLDAARNDPAGFVAHTGGPVILDEVQRAPELFAAIKAEVDRQRQPGRFLLTSSANILLMPKVSELQAAGQMETLTLRPFSQGEIAGEPELFIDRVFAETPLPASGEAHDLTVCMLAGGYPPAVELTDIDRRAWFSEYVKTILERDVREMAHIDALALRRLLVQIAARAGSLVNFAELARSVVMPKTTVKRYFELLESAFLVQCLPAWSSTDPGRRLIMAPKLFLGDTGMAAYLLGLNEERLEQDAQLRGALLENFVAAELLKQSGWSRRDVHVFHLRTAGGQQVGFVLEEVGGKIVGIEVKASAAIARRDFTGLRALAEMAGTKFHRGIILYAGRDSTGRSAVSSDPHLCALPVSALWESV